MKKTHKMLKYDKAGIIAMVIAFVIQIILNQQIKVMRSLPDEMGAIYLAAKLEGYDWSYIMTHPASYYGFSMFPLLYPFFILVKDAMILYQCLLAVGAFLRSIPAFLGCRILTKFYGWKNQRLLIGCGLICVFCTPTRSSNIDNEPMLIFLSWAIFYTIMELQFVSKKMQKINLTIGLSLLLMCSIITHTRAILYVIAVVLVIIIYFLIKGEQLVDFKIFGISLLSALAIGFWGVNRITNKLYFSEKIENATNTGSGLIDKILLNGGKLFSKNGAISYIEMLFSNVYICIMFSMGIVLSVCLILLYKYINNIVKKNGKVKIGEIDYAALFSCICFIVSLAGVGVVWMDFALATHLNGENLSRGHFYLRYYANAWGPLFLYQIILWKEESYRELNFDKIIIRTFIFINFFCMIILFIPAVGRRQFRTDWFYYVSSFSLKFLKWFEQGQDLSYYKVAGEVTILILVIKLLLTKKKKINQMIVFCLLVLMYEYLFGVVYFDKPFANSKNYYQAANGIYEMNKNNPLIFDTIENVYYLSPVFGPQYIVQFMLKDKYVINDYPEKMNENSIIITSDLKYIDKEKLCGFNYKYLIIDENEIILFSSKELEERYREYGYIMNDFYN